MVILHRPPYMAEDVVGEDAAVDGMDEEYRVGRELPSPDGQGMGEHGANAATATARTESP